MIDDLLRTHFPIFSELELRKKIESVGTVRQVAEGTTIMDIGSYVKVMPLVIRGAIKILREDERGNELLLYFLNPGQTCAMSLNCCMANVPSEVRAIAEEDTEFIALPTQVMDEYMLHTTWKNFVIQTYNERFYELLNTIDSIAFKHLDQRLVEYLENKSEIQKSKTINVTHQKLADDLNSSREVISRLLKQLERNGQIQLGRNKISLL